MNPWLRDCLLGFRFQMNPAVLRYRMVSAGALAGAVPGARMSGGDVTGIIAFGAGFYPAGRLLVWAML